MNAGVLAFAVCSMGSSSSCKSMFSTASMSAGSSSMNLAGAYAINSAINGGSSQ